MVLDSGSLSKHKDQEIAEIRRRKNRRLRYRAIMVACVLLFLFSLYPSWNKQHAPVEAGLDEDGFPIEEQSDELMDQSDLQQAWLERHATKMEIQAYSYVEEIILDWVEWPGGQADEEEAGKAAARSFSRELLFQFQKICLRVAFFIAASFRIWVLAAVLGLIIGARRFMPYAAQDILGLTGNGRLFFSGVQVAFSREGDSQRPELLVPGLACPRACDQKTLSESKLGRLIEQLGIGNATNNRLASVIVAYKDMPAFVANPGEEKILEDYVEFFGLEEYTCLLLENLANLHSEFRHYSAGQEEPVLRRNEETAHERMSHDQYQEFLKSAFRRVLQPWMRQAISRMSVAEIAALALAMEAGKALVYKLENGNWVRSSAFPHLSARAVLHAGADFSKDYGSAVRETLRRAIVYASRYNIFGMVRLPVDLDEGTRACRQWAELMLASPHEIQVAADEAELFGIIASTNEQFASRFFAEICGLEHFSDSEIYTSGTNLLLVPLRKIMEILRGVINGAALERLEELVSLVGQKQALQDMSSEKKGEDETAAAPCRILRSLPFHEMKRLAEAHNLSMDLMKDWSALRVVLSTFSWLARRVGNSSVPESALVFAIMRMGDESVAVKEGIIGRAGMVPLRGSRLRERFGPSWQSHFVMVDAVTMAESREENERLLAMGAQAFRDQEEDAGDNGRE